MMNSEKNRGEQILKLEECINFQLTLAQKNVNQNLTRRLAPYEITPSQYAVLNCLWQHDGCSFPHEIADALSLEMPTVSGILDRLQSKGMIGREINEENRREIHVLLTDKGRALEKDVIREVEDMNREVLDAFSEKERAELQKSLERLAKAL